MQAPKPADTLTTLSSSAIVTTHSSPVAVTTPPSPTASINSMDLSIDMSVVSVYFWYLNQDFSIDLYILFQISTSTPKRTYNPPSQFDDDTLVSGLNLISLSRTVFIIHSDPQGNDLTVESEATESLPKRPRHDADTSLHFKLTNDKQSITIPTPFPFPQNFPPIVECALRRKSIPPDAMSRFLSVMARATYAIKCYPAPGEYESIGVQVIQRYPFMKSPAGCPYVSRKCGNYIYI